MSTQYDEYLKAHKNGVKNAYTWIEENIPEVLKGNNFEWFCRFAHDDSKFSDREYSAYDDYFYGNQSHAVVEAFNKAWLHHIHKNPHHWQHWVLINDDDGKNRALEMPLGFVIEMICDWWSFSFNSGNLYEIFDWYEDHKDKMILHPKTKALVEDILGKIKKKLDKEKKEVEEKLEEAGVVAVVVEVNEE